MSRVSDAIRRAAEESRQGAPEASKRLVAPKRESREFSLKAKSQLSADAEKREPIDQDSRSQKHVDFSDGLNPNKRIKDQSPSTVSNQSALIPQGLTLRSRIKQALFGCSLRKIAPYPLIALEKNSHACEQYKILREQINKLISESARWSIAITSPIKGDGKTMVAANLAAAMALHHQQQILLVDADLRSPSIHHYFQVNSSPGLAEYLSSPDDGDLLDYVHDTSIPGLRILTAGKSTSQSSELLASERMKTLIEEIGAKFSSNQVIVDTSPVLSTSDPLILSRQLDGLLMVVRAGKTPRECLSEAIKTVGSDKIMGLVLNGAELGWASKYYYYYGQQ